MASGFWLLVVLLFVQQEIHGGLVTAGKRSSSSGSGGVPTGGNNPRPRATSTSTTSTQSSIVPEEWR